MKVLIMQVFPYVSVFLFLIAGACRVLSWARTPKRLNWKLYPAPKGLVEETQYIIKEWVTFGMIFKNNRPLWAGSYAFHLSLVVLGVWFVVFVLTGWNIWWLDRIGLLLLFASSAYLLILRTASRTMRAISTLGEYFPLLLFWLFSLFGILAWGEGIAQQAREQFWSLVAFSPRSQSFPFSFLAMVFVFEFIVAYIPLGKMFHVASKFFAFHKLRWHNPYEGKSPTLQVAAGTGQKAH